MTLEATKTIGPANSLEQYDAVVDGLSEDATDLLDTLLRVRSESEESNISAALLAVLAHVREGWDAVRVGLADSFATQAHALLNFVSSRVAFRNSANTAYVGIRVEDLVFSSTGATIALVTGSPEGAVSAVVGSVRLRIDGGASTTLYVKESGTGNTGWVAK